MESPTTRPSSPCPKPASEEELPVELRPTMATPVERVETPAKPPPGPQPSESGNAQATPSKPKKWHKNSPNKTRKPSPNITPKNTPKKQQVWPTDIAPGAPGAATQWEKWPEFTVLIDDLPSKATTADIWDWFSPEGQIAYIDIYDSRRYPGSLSARVRFQPPPGRAFWSKGKVSVPDPDERRFPNGVVVTVTPSRETPQYWVRSPVSGDRAFPVIMTLNARAVQFGRMLSPSSMKVMRTITCLGEASRLKVEVNVKFQRITIFFPIYVAAGQSRYLRPYKAIIDFSRLKEIYRFRGKSGHPSLVLPMQIPPNYYWRKPDIKAGMSGSVKTWSYMESWNRATDILEGLESQMSLPVALHHDMEDPGFIDLARWTTIRFTLSQDNHRDRETAGMIKSALGDFNIPTVECDDFEVIQGVQAEMWQHLDHPQTANEGNALSLLSAGALSVIQLEFEVRYQLEVSITRGILNEHLITVEFLQTLANMPPFQARHLLEFVVDQDEYIKDPNEIFGTSDEALYFLPTRVPHYCTLMRKAVITPTSIRFNTPAVETSNRIMRRYNNLQDRFLRVQFVDELEQGRITVNKDQNDEVWKRVLRTLFKGIRIGDRVYQFLAFGSSQLRQCGAYFFCPTDHVSCDDIRNWMGEFSHIKIVAKYAARLGQCFSTTREIRGISVPTIRPIEDIERNGYCFTDGVGKISTFVSQMVIEEMQLDVLDKPSAFQFRMGGCKGVLAVWPSAKGTEVHVRQSQEKFKSDFNGLEIIRCARYATATLNRQTITILESLKVPISAFMTLLEVQLKEYEKAATDNYAAIELLTKFIDENQTTLIIAELLRAGFKSDEIQEPFVVNIINLWRSWSLKLLKEKARVQIEKSAFVLGVVDETGTLRGHSRQTEGSNVHDVNKLPQIFLQLTDPNSYKKTRVIRGKCIVGRNPSLHPGDIRVVQAVDNPKLRHLKDVVVFPSKGDRPVPNMLSGGDLDGDDFFVIWDPTLIPKIWNYPPMDYAGPKPVHLNRDVNVNDLRNFFVTYMKNDTLPLIAIAHLALADELGPMSKKCLELADLHSRAVDFVKTGEPATLRRDLQPRRWPHFMEKKNSYHSNKALGVIYDKVANKAVQFNPILDKAFDQRVTKRFQLSNETLDAARKLKVQYDTSVRRLLSQHNLTTEFELWTAFAMSKPAIGSDYKRQEDLGHEYSALKHRFRDLSYEAAGARGGDQLDRFVAAMYVVTEEEVRLTLDEEERGSASDGGDDAQPRSMPLISFPWIFHWIMIRVALGGQYSPQDSLLAAARKRVNQAPRVEDQPLEGGSPSYQGREGEKMPRIVGHDMDTHLPDGTIIHRGQPLALFDAEDEGSVQQGEASTDEGESRERPTSGSKDERKGDDAGGEGLGEGSSATSDASEGDLGGLGDLGDLRETRDGMAAAEEESAMDRLAMLTGGDEDDEWLD